ncbi:MAG TPA: hypothetical protein VJM47_11675 [Nitrosospira sp.]|nr:hypothetical protein [Nitrosospira sp.]
MGIEAWSKFSHSPEWWGRYEVYRISLRARMGRCSSLQGAALRPHRALPRTWIIARSTPSNYGF